MQCQILQVLVYKSKKLIQQAVIQGAPICADTILVCDYLMKAAEQYFHVVMLCNVVLTVKSVDETLVCDHSNESY